MKPERKFRLLLAAVLVAGSGFGALSAYWFWAADRVESAIANWAEAQRARGYEIAYRGPEIDGFPFRLNARMERPSVVAPAGWRWSGDAIVGHGAVWAPLTLDLELPRAQQVQGVWFGRTRRAEATAAEGHGTVHFHADGKIDRASLRIADLTVHGEPDWTAHAASLDYDLTSVATAPDGTAEPRILIDGTAREVTLPDFADGPFGRTVERLGLDAEIVGPVPPDDPAVALAIWRDQGGRVDVRKLDVRWGPIEVEAKGSGTLDALLRPEGKFDARIRGLPEAVDVLKRRGLIQDGAALALKTAAFALAQSEAGSNRPVVTLPVTLRDGLVYLGPVAILRIGSVL
jgi:hypothetical protein